MKMQPAFCLDIVEGQRDLSTRIAAELQQRGCPIDTGEYADGLLGSPLSLARFLSCNGWLKMQKNEIESIGWISAEQLDGDPAASVIWRRRPWERRKVIWSPSRN